MLKREQLEEFETRGIVVIPKFLPDDTVQSLKESIDRLHGDKPYSNNGRWSLRHCLPHHQSFIDLLVDKRLLAMIVQMLGFNIKLLGSQVVKMEEGFKDKVLSVDWHRDGGALSTELPDPLPPAFVKVGFCVSGSDEPDGGELLMVPGSNCHLGNPVVDSQTTWPLGFSRVLTTPGDLVIFDWRTWHAVSRNSSHVVRRVLYFTFGFRWLSPMDYQMMPEELLGRSPLHRQLLGGATELGNYLPSDAEVPLRSMCLDSFPQGGGNKRYEVGPVVIDALRQRKEWQNMQRSVARRKSGNIMLARAIRDGTT